MVVQLAETDKTIDLSDVELFDDDDEYEEEYEDDEEEEVRCLLITFLIFKLHVVIC